jgi:hypothetical protein
VAGLVFAPYPNRFRAPFHRGPGPFDDSMYLDYLEDWVLVHQVATQGFLRIEAATPLKRERRKATDLTG